MLCCTETLENEKGTVKERRGLFTADRELLAQCLLCRAQGLRVSMSCPCKATGLLPAVYHAQCTRSTLNLLGSNAGKPPRC